MDTFSAAVMLFLIMDPLGNLPVFLSILRHVDPKRRRKVMIRELLFSLVIMMGFLFAGQQILSFLNLRQEAVSIAGGIILQGIDDGRHTRVCHHHGSDGGKQQNSYG